MMMILGHLILCSMDYAHFRTTLIACASWMAWNYYSYQDDTPDQNSFANIKTNQKCAFLKLETIISALTNNPAKILKINKGNLSIGNDADFCIVDINKPWIVKKNKLISKSKNTSIEDKKLQGKILNTFVKGKELFKL